MQTEWLANVCLLNNVEQVLAILGQLWLGQNNKEDLMKPDFHEGDEATDEQLIAYGKKEATDKEFIKEAVEQARLDALVQQNIANPLAVGDGV